MKKHTLSLLLAASLIAAPLSAETIVTVNGTRIDSSTIDQQVRLMNEQSNGQIQDSPALRENITRRMVTRELMIQEARRLKLHETAEFKEIIEKARTEARNTGEDRKPSFREDWATFEGNITAQALMVHILRNKPVSEDEVQSAYNEIQNRYRGTQEVQLAEIIVNTQENADKVSQALRRGQRFTEVARQYTIDPQGRNNGGLNAEYTPLKDLEEAAPVVFNAVKSLNRGAYTRTPVSGNGIFAFFYVHAKRNITVPTFEQLKPQLQEDLQNLRVEQEIARLYQQATIR